MLIVGGWELCLHHQYKGDMGKEEKLRCRGDDGKTIIDISGDGMLTKEILEPGNGESPPIGGTHTVSIHYTGKLMNGEIFDCSRERGRPHQFVLGGMQVTLGMDKGVATMGKGEKAILTCGPDYAYGSNGRSQVIPPNETLTFEVELIDWRVGTEAFDVVLTVAQLIGAFSLAFLAYQMYIG
jgi:FKBP-type peptidyl-prolyl cis-trans isomerase